MTIPPPDHVPPPPVARLAAQHGLGAARPVWLNELGGVTFAFAASGQFVKWAPHHPELDFRGEAERLRWAGRFVRVPVVLDVGCDEDGQWLRTEALSGESAVSPRWLSEPVTAARAIGEGLRHLHDTLPVDRCPFSWSREDRSARIKLAQDRELIAQAPPIDRLVVCHGDACAPNTLIGRDGRCSGHVDLGHLGVADRWADLAVATYSLAWNYPGDHEAELLEAYGVQRDEERIAYYRRLWDAT